MEALKNAMRNLTSKFSSQHDQNPLFCYESLTENGKILCISKPLFSDKALELLQTSALFSPEGIALLNEENLFAADLKINVNDFSIAEEYPISLLADEDFLYFMKCFCKDGLGHEYFARNRRRTAVWKSEAEFWALFQDRIGDKSESSNNLVEGFKCLANWCQNNTGVPIIDNKIWAILDKEESYARSAKTNGDIDTASCEDILKGVNTSRKWAKVLETASNDLAIKFEFLILPQKKFSSSFNSSIGDIPILFPNVTDTDKVLPLKKVIDILMISADRTSNFFYLFYIPPEDLTGDPVDEGRKNDRKKQIKNGLTDILITGANSR